MLKIVPNSPKVLLISISEQDIGTGPSHKVLLQTEEKNLKQIKQQCKLIPIHKKLKQVRI